jgi:hypothetical protein
MFDNVHHKTIKRFRMAGSIKDDSAIWRLKNEYIRLLKMDMKSRGYAERLDIDPDFTIRYNEKEECFEFVISVYGTYVGKSKIEWIIGLDGTTAISTQKNKLKESCLDQESQSSQK